MRAEKDSFDKPGNRALDGSLAVPPDSGAIEALAVSAEGIVWMLSEGADAAVQVGASGRSPVRRQIPSLRIQSAESNGE